MFFFGHFALVDPDDEASTERNMAAVSPIPKIVTTTIKEDSSRDEEDYRDDWGKLYFIIIVQILQLP